MGAVFGAVASVVSSAGLWTDFDRQFFDCYGKTADIKAGVESNVLVLSALQLWLCSESVVL